MKIKIELDNDVRLVWPTPIFNRAYPNTSDMNTRLLEIVHQKEQEDKGTTQKHCEWMALHRRRPHLALSRS